MPEFNNLLEAEAYYKEESQAKAEKREPNHNPEIIEVEVHENTVFNPNPDLTYSVVPEPETIVESGSPYVEFSEVEVEPTYDPAVLTHIPIYNADGTDASVDNSDGAEVWVKTETVIPEPTPIADSILDSPVANDVTGSNTPVE